MWTTLLVALAFGGAWTRGEGEYYAKAGGDAYWALSWDQAGADARKSDRFLGQLYGVYGEVGLPTGHPTQVSVSMPVSRGTLWFVREADGETLDGHASVTRLGDLRLRPQIALVRDKPIAAALEVKLPLYQVDSVCANQPRFQPVCPRPGDGQIDLQGWLLGGGSVGRSFFEGGLGYQHRTEWYLGWNTSNSFGDSIVFTGGGGTWTGPVLWMGRLDGSWWPVDDGFTPQSVRVGPQVLIDVADWLGVEARAQMDVQARHAAQGLGFGLGVSSRTR